MATDTAVPDADQRALLEEYLQEAHRRHLPRNDAVNYYSPERGTYSASEAGRDGDQFGIAVASVHGWSTGVGDMDTLFALQSISKVFVHGLALADHGRATVLRHVGVEPSGDAFNSLVFDEHNNRPFNPMVNAGALATANLIAGVSVEERMDRVLTVMRNCADNQQLSVDRSTFEGELGGADRSRATAYLMRSDGMLTGDVELTLSLYLQQCSVTVTCRDLATMGATLANAGVCPTTGQRALPADAVRDMLSVMHTCGMYDFAGEWAYTVGLPAKSGVSGGILVVVPGRFGIGVFSPGLDRFGNSVRGTRVCEELSTRLGWHVFDTRSR